MLRLFGIAGLLVITSSALAIGLDSPLFRVLTVVLGSAVAGLYWFLRRSSPHGPGTLRLPGLLAPVEVYWDDQGVPHVYAENCHDLYMAQGYLTAQDRLWQMDLHRRTASGRMAEVFGPELLPLDQHFRTIGLHRAAEASWAAYSIADQALLEAYAAGINARIAEKHLPPEFTLRRYWPEPWQPTDTLLLSKHLAYTLTSDWTDQLIQARLVQTVGAEKVAELLPDQDGLHALESVSLPLLNDLLHMALEGTCGASGGAWVVAGSRTESGAPLLASNPTLPLRCPAAWYESHLVCADGLDVAGVTVPGIPGIILGHNREIAWGLAGVVSGVQQVHFEQVNLQNPTLFRDGGEWAPAKLILEQIHVRGRCSVSHEVRATERGPVLRESNATALTLSWPALGATTEVAAFLAINRARGWSEFKQALEPFNLPAWNFLFAGRDGTVAQITRGRLPAGADTPLEPVVNPPEGFIATQDPTAGGSAYWAERVAERVRCTTRLTLERAQEIQTDTVNLQARSLLQILLNALQEGLRQGPQPETLTEIEKRALLIVTGWDCNELSSSAAPLLWHQWYLFIQEGIFSPQLDWPLFYQFLSYRKAAAVTDRLIRRVAEGTPSAWLGQEGDQSLARVTLHAFRRSVALLSARHGNHPDRWAWGEEHIVRFEHPMGTQPRALRPFLMLGPYPASGSCVSVHGQGYRRWLPYSVIVAPTWRSIVDTGRPESGVSICAPGQSGHLLSPHYADQFLPWIKGEYLPEFYRHQVVRTLPHLRLDPDHVH